MSFSAIVGNGRNIASLQKILGSGRVAHAYLFTGPEGIGKKMAALAFVKALFCGSEDGCGICSSCKKIASGNHPDIHCIEPDGTQIKVDQVRALQRELSFRPYEASRKACIIDGADRFNPSSGNSLLKTLEEPPGNALMILVANSADAVLPTIRSRCQILQFSQISEDELTGFLEERGVAPENARVAASLANGTVTKAIELAAEDGLAGRETLLKGVCGLSKRSLTNLFAFAEQFDKDRENTLRSLELITGFWRDMLHLKSGSSDIANNDLAYVLEREAAKRPLSSIMEGLDKIARTRQTIARNNANVRLAMDNLFIGLAL